MINFFGANQILRVITSSAATLDIIGAYTTGDGQLANDDDGIFQAIAAATTTVLADAPGDGKKRHVYALSICNTHASLACAVTLQVFDGTNARRIKHLVLAAGEQAIYNGLNDWTYFNAQGLPKISQSQGSASSFVGLDQSMTLPADVVNNNAVANTLQDVTGLGFAVLAGGVFKFRFRLLFTAAATTTGSRWTIGGPAFSWLDYRSVYSLTTTTETVNMLLTAYDQPAACNVSSALTTINVADIWGEIIPSVDGFVQAKFASEIAGSAITAKRGSTVDWRQVA